MIGWLAVALTAAAVGSPGDGEATLPPDARIVARAASEDGRLVELYLDLPARFVRDGLSETWLDGMSHHWSETLLPEVDDRVGPDRLLPRGVVAYALDPDDLGAGWKPLTAFLPRQEPVPKREYEPQTGLDGSPAPPLVSLGAGMPGEQGGFLTGKVVYISQAHGFTWDEGSWVTQRPNTHDIVEDLVNSEGMNHYLMNYLRNAGAMVFTVREEDMQSEMVIVDAEPGGATSVEGAGEYVETGTWEDSTASGFQAGNAPYIGDTNPHALGGTRFATAATGGAATASATWTPSVPSAGYYAVYASYAASQNRVPDAHYVVTHAGGETHFRVNQQRHGNTWIRLGRFWFEAGQDAGVGAVTLLNDTLVGTSDQVISADAVRFGGGFGDMQRSGTGSAPPLSPTSQIPRWRECSRYYSQFMGAPTSVYNGGGDDRSDDVGNRSRTAAWHNEAGEDAVYVSWHSNAPNPARGTSTYVYSPNPPPDSVSNFSGVTGSVELATLIQNEIVNDIRAAWVPDWQDRGVRAAYFGELSPNNNPEMPSALIEAAFHSTAADADYLEEPRFRQTIARAVYQAVVKYFAERDGVQPVLAPEPPNRLRVVNGPGAGEVTVSWDAPYTDTADLKGDAATGYRVHMSLDGRGFDNGTVVEDDTTLVVSGLQAGQPVFFKVVATNEGGTSMPTPTIPAVVTCDGAAAPAVAVMGFYRMDSSLLPRDDLSAWNLGTGVKALRYWQVNTYDHLVEHAWALSTAGLGLDGAEATAIEDGALALAPYQAALWQLGEESTVDETFSDAEQAAVSAWLALGGKTLVASGAEILWDLVQQGDAGDEAFAAATFGADYGSDDGDTYALDGTGTFSDLPPITLSDGTDGLYGSYNVEYPDVLLPLSGAQSVLEYGNGAGSAATWFEGANHNALLMGFPLEAVQPTTARAALVNAIVELTGLPTIGTCAPVIADPGAEVGPDAPPEAPPEQASDVVVVVDAAGPDAAPDAGAAEEDPAVADAGPPRAIATVLPGSSSSSISGDEGCSSGSTPVGLGWLVLVFGLALALRRASLRANHP